MDINWSKEVCLAVLAFFGQLPSSVTDNTTNTCNWLSREVQMVSQTASGNHIGTVSFISRRNLYPSSAQFFAPKTKIYKIVSKKCLLHLYAILCGDMRNSTDLVNLYF